MKCLAVNEVGSDDSLLVCDNPRPEGCCVLEVVEDSTCAAIFLNKDQAKELAAWLWKWAGVEIFDPLI